MKSLNCNPIYRYPYSLCLFRFEYLYQYNKNKMPYSGLKDFVRTLEKAGELHRIKTFVDPILEITELTDRITKNNGKALLFENTGTEFPLLINAFGSDKRMALALGRDDITSAAAEMERLFDLVAKPAGNLSGKLKSLPLFIKMGNFFPSRSQSRGDCQKVVAAEPDLSVFPILKCWPHDGGRFITLPIVHTRHPETGSTNTGMYRMQIIDKKRTGMHWQRHKTGAAHFEAWKKTGRRMPVSVTLGGDPVYTYCATAPLPENISEYILAGFLRKRKVGLVKCLTNDLYVPGDADIVIEGYVDPSEPFFMEGPFGDHTGFYSLADLYPVFNVTCITHSEKAVYPATVVGIPPMEDAWLAKATEKLFLTPVRLAIQPEVTDFHFPEAGVAHNLTIVKIDKKYPGQGKKVVNSLLGAGQMMFTKYLAVVSSDTDIRDYRALARTIMHNTSPERDIIFQYGPLDVLDHASDTFSYGGKAAIDATLKLPEESCSGNAGLFPDDQVKKPAGLEDHIPACIRMMNTDLFEEGIPLIILGVNPSEDPGNVESVTEYLGGFVHKQFTLALIMDHTVPVDDLFTVAWQALGNSDPVRDHKTPVSNLPVIDATIKYYREGGFSRRWPNVVCSATPAVESIDRKWNSLGLGDFIPSPSLKAIKLLRNGSDYIDDQP